MRSMTRRAFARQAGLLTLVPAVAAAAPAGPPDPELVAAARRLKALMDRLCEMQPEASRLLRRWYDAGRPTDDPERGRFLDVQQAVEDEAEDVQRRLHDLMCDRDLAGLILDGVFFYGPLCPTYGLLDYCPDQVQPIALANVVNLDAIGGGRC